jgi:hypothetical protein
MQSRKCGNCTFFVRIKSWGGTRNGFCNKLDYNVNSDSSYAKSCRGYKSIKYIRVKVSESKNNISILHKET